MKYLKLIQFIFLLSLVDQSFTQSSQIDSLKFILNTAKEDTSKVNTLNALAFNVFRSNPDEAIKIGSEAKNLAEQLNFHNGLAYALKYIGLGYYMQGNYVEATTNFEQSLEIFESIEDETGISNILGNLGAIHLTMGDDARAIEYFLRSMKIAENIGDSIRIITCLINVGVTYSKDIKKLDKAHEYLLSSLKISESINYLEATGNCSFNLGDLFLKEELYDSALYYFEKSLIANANTIDEAASLNYIGKTYSKKGDYQIAIKYQQQALEIAKKAGSKLEVTDALLGLANTHKAQGNPGLAINYFEQAETIAEEVGLNYELKDALEGLAFTYVELFDYRNAFNYLSLLRNIEKTIYNIETDDRIRNLMFSYQIEKKEDQIELQESQLIAKDVRIEKQKIFRNALIGGLGAVVLFILVIAYAYNQKRKDNKKITEQNFRILNANEELKKLNEITNMQKDEIISSIQYAKRIQSAILPPEVYITELLNENFVFYKPKEIVSGDFYWIKQVKHYVILICADCTGHGVPGAFMSMLGISYLNEIVQRREITQANQILNELRKQIKHSLRQSGDKEESRDGIDLALCVIDSKKNILQYSGAYNPLYIINTINGEPVLKEIKGDSMPVGVHFSSDKPFTNHEFKIEIGDTIYIFSDGFVDQIGGEDNTKFRSGNFKKLLTEIHDRPMYEQKEILNQTLKEWMGINPQRDDILVIGARLG